jgi:heme/copper-type cytochrome/quinol oxidase subunit 2
LDAAQPNEVNGEQMKTGLNQSYKWEPLFYLLFAMFALAVNGCAKKPENIAPRVVAVTMKKGDIEPKEIRAKQGEKVKLTVSTLDVQHGFEIPELKVSEPVNPGQPPAEIALDTSKAGTFGVECGVMCGAHHDEMKAKVIVE